MRKTASNKTGTRIVTPRLLARNRDEVGRYFKKLLKEGLGKWEQRVLALLCRSDAYKHNDLPKLLELAEDLRAAHWAQIEFVEKYVGGLFLPKAVKIEREESAFLDEAIIPYVTRLVDQGDSR